MKKHDAILIHFLILTAFGLRLFGLGESSLWGDEGLSLARARATWTDLLQGLIILMGVNPIVTVDNHPPFYFIILKIWRYFGGDSEFSLRFVSVFASILL